MDENSSLFKHMFDQLKAGTLLAHLDGTIQFVNEAYCELTGFSKKELLEKNIHNYLESFAIKNNEEQGEVSLKRKGKTDLSQWLYINPIVDERGKKSILYVIRDFHICGFDPLTKLPNRYLLNQKLCKALAHAKEKQKEIAVFFIDLDRFKFVNDTLGHASGDILLKVAADRIQQAIGEGNSMFRMGGDEFVCIIEHLEKIEESQQYAKKIIQSFTEPIQLKNTEIYITVSIGISIFPFDGDEADLLITNADTAMYEAKRRGKNMYKKANVANNAGAYEKLLLENSLRKAIEEEQFTLRFQPQINIQTNELNTFEALIRWEHPELGLISPGYFIPIAEETGLIIAIDEWVLKTACQKAKHWQEMGLPPVKVAVNLSAAQFLHHDLVDKVDRILAETKLDPTYLELEVTENMVMHDVKAAVNVLKKLKARGISISIDDFGTGYSSLSYLKELPLDTLKIDRSFIKDLEQNEHSLYLTKAIVTLAHDLNLQVIAEGVENVKQLHLMREQACDAVQGYYFSKPLPEDEVVHFIKEATENCIG